MRPGEVRYTSEQRSVVQRLMLDDGLTAPGAVEAVCTGEAGVAPFSLAIASAYKIAGRERSRRARKDFQSLTTNDMAEATSHLLVKLVAESAMRLEADAKRNGEVITDGVRKLLQCMIVLLGRPQLRAITRKAHVEEHLPTLLERLAGEADREAPGEPRR